jgi:pimeloyl-ACP methyl ester carboxylesterase
VLGKTGGTLAEDYDVILLDARGHGLSDKPESGYSYADHAADVAGVIDMLKLDPPVVIGHSMGAGTATLLAATCPDRVRALVLEDPAWVKAPDSEAEGEQRLSDWKAWLIGCKTLSVEELAAKQQANSPVWDASEFRVWAESKQAVSPNVLEIARHPRLIWQEIVPAIQCPFLLVTAELSQGAIVSPEVAAEVGKLPTAKVEHIAGAGHNVRREQYERFIEVVREFLKWL